MPRPVRGFRTRDDLVRWLRGQLFLASGSAKDVAIARELDRWIVANADG